MRNASRTLTVAVLAVFAALSSARAADDTRARKLMEEAFNHRYRWPESLKSFSADFTLTREGKNIKGSLKADVTKSHGGVTVECGGIDGCRHRRFRSVWIGRARRWRVSGRVEFAGWCLHHRLAPVATRTTKQNWLNY